MKYTSRPYTSTMYNYKQFM